MQHLHFPEPALKAIVNKYRWATKYSAGLDLDDLAQVAREAVERAKPVFDPDRGGRSFFGFAWMCARQAVQHHANEHLHAVRMPQSTLANRNGGRRAYTNSITLRADPAQHGYGDADDTLLDVWGVATEPHVETDLDTARTRARVRACVDAVRAADPYHGWVLAGLYLDGRSHESMADERGVSRQAIAHIRARALRDFAKVWAEAGWELP